MVRFKSNNPTASQSLRFPLPFSQFPKEMKIKNPSLRSIVNKEMNKEIETEENKIHIRRK